MDSHGPTLVRGIDLRERHARKMPDMQPLPPAIADAGRALASGDALRALGLVGRTESALGMTLRGIAYAQLGDLELARESLARAEVLLGRLNDARHRVDELVASDLPDDVRAVASLAQAEIAMRAVSPSGAREALTRARKSLEQAPNALLARALVAIEQELTRPIARLVREGRVREADLFVIEEASRGEVLLVDACRRLAIGGRVTVPLARRPVLFALLLELARAWPAALSRDELAMRAFDARRVNDSHRARLRVELGRLRKLVVDCGVEPVASGGGYVLASKRDVALLLPPSDDDDARIALLLGDGAAWTARGVAEHAGVSKSTAQRALAALVERGAVVRTGKGKDIRYTRAATPIASRMLLLGLVPKP